LEVGYWRLGPVSLQAVVLEVVRQTLNNPETNLHPPTSNLLATQPPKPNL